MNNFDSLLQQATETEFSGWDFSHLRGRMVQEPLAWSYRDEVIQALSRATSVLDMDTGGGEALASLSDHLPGKVIATEAYPPNVELARRRLGLLNVAVIHVSDEDLLPFDDGEFDLIINRHGSLPAPEISRVLGPGGELISQQVGGNNLADLNRALDLPVQDSGWNLQAATSQIESAGLQLLDGREGFFLTSFSDVGAIAYYLKAVPWQAPDFELPKHKDRLEKLHEQIESDGPFKAFAHRFFIQCRKPELQLEASALN